MSRTFKDQRKYKKKIFWDKWHEENRTINPWFWWSFHSNSDKAVREFISKNKCFKNDEQFYTDYSGAPSWWTRLFSNLPKRRQESLFIRKITVNIDLADELLFPLSRKPFTYYY